MLKVLFLKLGKVKPLEVFRYNGSWHQKEATGYFNKKLDKDKACYSYSVNTIVAVNATSDKPLNSQFEDDIPF